MSLGTSYSEGQVKAELDRGTITYRKLSNADLLQYLPPKLNEGNIVGLFRGRMEFGPRALGNRSIIASPTFPNMQKRINILKGRESFRPVAPVVTEESFTDYFEGWQNRYMLFTVKVREGAKKRVPAIAHVDGTARVQTVREKDDQFMHDLLKQYSQISGVPVLINTSLNAKGKPIVESPSGAIGLFYSSGLDLLIIENFLVEQTNSMH